MKVEELNPGDRVRDDSVGDVQIELDRTLSRLSKLFKPGVKMTLLVRNSEDSSRDIYLTDDDPEKAIASIRRLTGR